MVNHKTLLVLGLSIFCAVPCYAVNFYDGARAPKGLYFLTYTSFYEADKVTDAQGKTSETGYDYSKIEETARFCYYTPDSVFTALFSAGRLRSGLYDVTSSGFGDLNIGIGHFLPLKQADILPMLFVKLPTGEYDSGKSFNYGTNQYDIKPTIFFYKAWSRFSVDSAVKYFFRAENPATDISPGNELYLQALLGWQFTSWCKAGPSINWMRGQDQKNNGSTIKGSARRYLSVGGDLYVRLPRMSVSLTYLKDVQAHNTTKGDFFQIKTCYKF